MSDELRIAVNCHDSRQRPALKRKCSKCVISSSHKLGPNHDHLPGGGNNRSDSSYIDNTYVPGLPESINELYHHHQDHTRTRSRQHPVCGDRYSDSEQRSHHLHHHHHQPINGGKFGPSILSTLIRRTPSLGHRVKHGPWSTVNSSRVLSTQFDSHQQCPGYGPSSSYPYEENDDSDIAAEREELTAHGSAKRSGRLSNNRNNNDDEEEEEDTGERILSVETRNTNPINRSSSALGYNRSLVDVECYRDSHHSRQQYIERMTPSPPSPPPPPPNGIDSKGLKATSVFANSNQPLLNKPTMNIAPLVDNENKEYTSCWNT